MASGFHYQCGAVVEEYRNCTGECTYYVWNRAFGFSDNNEICCQSYGKPTKKLVDSMTAYQEGNFDSRFKVESQDEISQIGMVYNQMADKVQNLIEKNYTLEIANREAEIEFLKMQINPHFLYNCLDTISWLGFQMETVK